MTEENKKENIKIQLDKASEILREADILYNNGFVTGAIRREYSSQKTLTYLQNL